MKMGKALYNPHKVLNFSKVRKWSKRREIIAVNIHYELETWEIIYIAIV